MNAKETGPEENGEDTNRERDGGGFLQLLGFLAILVAIAGAFYVAMVWLGEHVSAARASNQADRAAVLNAVISAFAFAALLFALYLQRNELRLQREELRLQRKELTATREVLDEQRKQLEEQSKTFRQQSLDDTFFQLLRLHHEIVNSLHVQQPLTRGERIEGRQALTKIAAAVTGNYVDFRKTGIPPFEAAQAAYKPAYIDFQFLLGHYFRNLYHVIRFAHRSYRPWSAAYKRTTLVRAQLSSSELVLLYFNCLSDEGKKFKPLVERYSLLKHLREENIDKAGRDLYDERAFVPPVK